MQCVQELAFQVSKNFQLINYVFIFTSLAQSILNNLDLFNYSFTFYMAVILMLQYGLRVCP